ncbi:MAG: GNAT family N-acetyltransferase [Anaerolineales bacterium]|nr:GNAT family N-acetyltransferase [Anaerolineales bacterium]
MTKIRPALLRDAPGIAQVHVQSWQTSYRNIVSDEVLHNQSISRRQGYWEQILAYETSGEDLHCVFVAENDTGEIVGFASAGKSRQENLPFGGELYAIYLLEAVKRQGIGEKLFRAVTKKLRAEGFLSMMLWVLADNVPGRRFYEKMGGHPVIEQAIVIGGQELIEIAYGWNILES